MFDSDIPVFTEQELRDGHRLEKVKMQFGQYDESYVANACFPARRDVLSLAYSECRPFLDKNFHLEIRQPGKFFPRLWELQICSLLRHWGMDIQPNANKKKSVPDFCVKSGDSKIWIEAVCPDLGDTDPAPAHPQLRPGEMYSQTRDIASDNRPRVLRASSALDRKIKKYRENYLPAGIVNSSDSYVVAINTHRICWLGSDMVEEQLLYGMGLHQLDLQTGHASRQWVPQTVKQSNNGSLNIPVAYFLRAEYKFISACIFSDRWFDFDVDWKDNLSGHTRAYFNEGAAMPVEDALSFMGNRTRSKTTLTEISLERLT